MAGVRGFNDANLQMNNGVPVWKQLTTKQQTTATDYVTPWYLNYLGGNWSEATQCMSAGGNGWNENHAAWNFGSNDHWAMNNTPWSIGFYKKDDLPTHFALAESFVIGDMYQVNIPFRWILEVTISNHTRNLLFLPQTLTVLAGFRAQSMFLVPPRSLTKVATHTLITMRPRDAKVVELTAFL